MATSKDKPTPKDGATAGQVTDASITPSQTGTQHRQRESPPQTEKPPQMETNPTATANPNKGGGKAKDGRTATPEPIQTRRG